MHQRDVIQIPELTSVHMAVAWVHLRIGLGWMDSQFLCRLGWLRIRMRIENFCNLLIYVIQSDCFHLHTFDLLT